MTSSQRWMKGVTKKSDFQGIINWGIKGRERGQKWTSFMNNPLVKRQKKIMSFSKRLFSLYSVYNGQVRMTSVLFCYIELSFMAPFWKREVVSWGQKLKIRGHHFWINPKFKIEEKRAYCSAEECISSLYIMVR